MQSILEQYIRPVTVEDKLKLPRFSYSKIEQFLNCPYAYDLKYNQKCYSKDTSLALELGSLMHLILEQKGKILQDKQTLDTTDYQILTQIEHYGYAEEGEGDRQKPNEILAGVDELKDKYWEVWCEPDSEGHTYDWKIDTFHTVLENEMSDEEQWHPTYFELPFEFVWDNKAIISGFIDRIDMNDKGDYRVIDYKTSKKPFADSALPTSLQFGIYNLAILNEFQQLPVSNVYRFIFIDETQYALTKGWEKRLLSKLTKIFEQIEECEQSENWKPNPCPLCYWCGFNELNPNATQYKDLCQYYALWTPTNKTFETKNDWNTEISKPSATRTLVF